MVTRTSLVTLVDRVTIKTLPTYRRNCNTIFIDDKMILYAKMDSKCNKAGGIDPVSPQAEGIEHGYVSLKQQTIIIRQFSTAKVGNEVRV